MIATPPHLGGHLGTSWTDEPVLDYLVARYDVRTMLDVGCGPGAMIDLAKSKGLIAWGIDGDPTIEHDWIVIHDFTVGPQPAGNFDLIWCVEFVEHVAAECQENYLATFAAGRVLYLTHALPGQGGHHHVNEQWDCYWIDLLEGHGWKVDNGATVWTRVHSATPFGRMSGLVFVRE